MEEQIGQAARLIADARKTVVLTGAGISTESGIPDFRSADGIWSRYDPAEYATLDAFLRDPEKVWRMLSELEELLQAEPNAGHTALAELEEAGAVAGIVTQNVDGLHQAGGSRNVVEFHGSSRTYSCLECGMGHPREAVRAMGVPPRCTAQIEGGPCGAILKPDVVFFDEMIPPSAIEKTEKLVGGADLILVVGTSCEVFPAAEIPLRVRGQGGKIVEFNLEPARGLPADIVLAGKAATLLPAVVARWKRLVD